MESGESLLSALERELLEEVGIECLSVQLLDVYHNSSISTRDHVAIYVVNNWQKIEAHEIPRLEITETAWFELDRLPQETSACSYSVLQAYQFT